MRTAFLLLFAFGAGYFIGRRRTLSASQRRSRGFSVRRAARGVLDAHEAIGNLRPILEPIAEGRVPSFGNLLEVL